MPMGGALITWTPCGKVDPLEGELNLKKKLSFDNNAKKFSLSLILSHQWHLSQVKKHRPSRKEGKAHLFIKHVVLVHLPLNICLKYTDF